MLAYIIRRILLIIPTLFGIMVINFAIVHVAPGGPVEQMIAEIKGTAVSATGRFSGDEGSEVSGQQQNQTMGQGAGSVQSKYRGAQGLDPEFVKQIEKQLALISRAMSGFSC